MSSVEDFEEYVAARLPSLMRTAYLLTGNQHDAEDLAQATLLKAAGAWRRIAGQPDAYVRRIMVNENISRWRRRPRGEFLVGSPPESAQTTNGGEAAMDLRLALRSLAPRQRAVIVLRFYEELTERETAEALGVSVSTVKSQTRDALSRLRALLPEVTLPV